MYAYTFLLLSVGLCEFANCVIRQREPQHKNFTVFMHMTVNLNLNVNSVSVNIQQKCLLTVNMFCFNWILINI